MCVAKFSSAHINQLHLCRQILEKEFLSWIISLCSGSGVVVVVVVSSSSNTSLSWGQTGCLLAAVTHHISVYSCRVCVYILSPLWNIISGWIFLACCGQWYRNWSRWMLHPWIMLSSCQVQKKEKSSALFTFSLVSISFSVGGILFEI